MNRKKFLSFLVCLIFIIIISITYAAMDRKFMSTGNKKNDGRIMYRNDIKLLNELTSSASENPNICINNMETKIKSEKDSLKLGIYNQVKGMAYFEKKDNEQAKRYFNEAIKNYENSPYSKPFEFKLYLFLTQFYMKEGNRSISLNYCYKALNIIYSGSGDEILKDGKEECEIVTDVILLKLFVENEIEDKAYDYYNKINAIDKNSYIYEKYEDLITYANYLYEITVGNEDKAIQHIYELYNRAEKEQLKSPFICKEDVRLELVRVKLKSNKLEGIISDLEKAKEFFKQENNLSALAHCYIMYGQYFETMKEFTKAKDSYDEAKKYYNFCGSDLGKSTCCDKVIHMSKSQNISIDLSTYYEEYFESSKRVKNDDGLNLMISSITDISQEANNVKLKDLKKEKVLMENRNNVMRRLSYVLIMIIMCMVVIADQLYIQTRRRKESERLLREVVNTDYLTQCYTKAYGYEKIQDLVLHNNNFYLAMIDIDDFKQINDTYGHLFGDLVLTTIGVKIKETLDSEDFVIRFGGEEFIVVLRDMPMEYIKQKLEDIRIMVESMTWEVPETVTISIGAAGYNEGYIKDFINKVDELLYRAKRLGKNRVEME